jgi:hypothetical protein
MSHNYLDAQNELKQIHILHDSYEENNPQINLETDLYKKYRLTNGYYGYYHRFFTSIHCF